MLNQIINFVFGQPEEVKQEEKQESVWVVASVGGHPTLFKVTESQEAEFFAWAQAQEKKFGKNFFYEAFESHVEAHRKLMRLTTK